MCSQRRRNASAKGAFTLIELMVVIAIIVLAAGLMAPTITDFFKNRELEGVRGEIGAAFNRARLKAVNEGGRASIVFFREGVRVYDERLKQFVDDLFNPDHSALAQGEVWVVLGFLNGTPSTELVPYRKWERAHLARLAETRRGESGTARVGDGAVNVAGLPKIVFERDGSLTFASGSDVSSAFFKEEIPGNADLIIYQTNNTTACYIDLRLPGQLRSKMVPIGKIMPRPDDGGLEDSENT